ncbi:Imm9 family immunity protein [Cohnella boryungensis]|uniref:Imm9 family immunity protein n=1 Tax=Cohnella boryungensis TaxID=768479 RepID=A0ABV8SGB3_9BACL
MKQASYGLGEKHFIRISNDHALHDPLDARFADYTDLLQTCLTTNVLRALNAALVRGVTVAGKRFKLDKMK